MASLTPECWENDDLTAASIAFFAETGSFTQGLFAGMRVLRPASARESVVALRVRREHLNAGGTLHGGCQATLVDVCTSIAVAKAHAERRAGVTASLAVRCVSPAREGDVLVVRSRVARVGRHLAFAECEISLADEADEADGAAPQPTERLVCLGSHVKFVGQAQKPLPVQITHPEAGSTAESLKAKL